MSNCSCGVCHALRVAELRGARIEGLELKNDGTWKVSYWVPALGYTFPPTSSLSVALTEELDKALALDADVRRKPLTKQSNPRIKSTRASAPKLEDLL